MAKQEKNNQIKFSLNLKNYPLEAIYGAAYVFLDKAYLYLDTKKNDKIEVFLKPKSKISKKQLEEIKGEFLNELLNYTIRVKLLKNNKKIRELIIGEALVSAVGLSQESQDSVDYEDDPLGIAIPWEEKYQK